MSAASAIFRAYLAVWSQYRFNSVVWSFATLLSVLVSLSVWQTVARAGGGSFVAIIACGMALAVGWAGVRVTWPRAMRRDHAVGA